MSTTQLHLVLMMVICDLFGVWYLFVQIGMGWVFGLEFIVVIANVGVLGIFVSGMLIMVEIEEVILCIKDFIDQMFGVNMRGDLLDVLECGCLLVKYGVRVASFVLVLNEKVIWELKDVGFVVVLLIGARCHVEKVVVWGVDVVIVQGGEGGGHIGAVFMSILLLQVVDVVDILVIGVGGFFDGCGLVAALVYGVAGVAMGIWFLLTSDCIVLDAVKVEYFKCDVNGMVVMSVLDGVFQWVLCIEFVEYLLNDGCVCWMSRSMRNAFAFQKMFGMLWCEIVHEGLSMKKMHELNWEQMLMAANTSMMLRLVMVEGCVDCGTLVSGQVVGVIDDLLSCVEFVECIVRDVSEILYWLGGN